MENTTKATLLRFALATLATACTLALCAALPHTAWAASGNVATTQEFLDAIQDESIDQIKLSASIDLTNKGALDASGKTIDLNGNTISANNFSLFFIGTDFTIKNGSFDSNGGSYALFIGDDPTSDKVLLESLTLSGGINVFNAHNVVVRDCTVTGTKHYAIWCDENGQVIVESGQFKSNGANVLGLMKTDVNSTLTIKGGSFDSINKPLVLPGDEYGTPVISGGEFSEDVSEYVPENYAELVKAQADANGKYVVLPVDEAADKASAQVTEDGKLVFYESVDEAKTEAGSTGDVFVRIAEVNGTVYESVQAAIEAAADGGTVKLLQDVDENVVVPEDANATLDLNGKTLNGNAADGAPAILNYGTLLIDDSSATAAGTIKRDDDGTAGNYAIDNQGTMTIEGGTVEGVVRTSVLSDEVPAKTTITGDAVVNGTIAVAKDDATLTSAPTVEISGGTLDVTFDVSDDSSTVQVSGGTFSEEIPEAYWAEGFEQVKNPDGTFTVKSPDAPDPEPAPTPSTEQNGTAKPLNPADAAKDPQALAQTGDPLALAVAGLAGMALIAAGVAIASRKRSAH